MCSFWFRLALLFLDVIRMRFIVVNQWMALKSAVRTDLNCTIMTYKKTHKRVFFDRVWIYSRRYYTKLHWKHVLFDFPHHSILSFHSILRLHLFPWQRHILVPCTCSEAQPYAYPITSNKADNCSRLKWNPSSHCCVKSQTLCQISLFYSKLCVYL